MIDTELVPQLYHGTCPDYANSLLKNRWSPNSGTKGGNSGNPRYLYPTTTSENAQWYAQEKGCNTIIALINIPKSMLMVDPEDGSNDTVDEELSMRLPGCVVLTQALGPEHFKLIKA
jgi:hypothetical protein